MRSNIYHKIVPEPIKPFGLPPNSKWLSGEGCGSWFNIENAGSNFVITRFSPEGSIECRGLFKPVSGGFNIMISFDMAYLSHCAEINLLQNGMRFKFLLIEKI